MASLQTSPDRRTRHEAAIREAARRGETEAARRLATEYRRLYSDPAQGNESAPEPAPRRTPTETPEQLAREAARTGGWTSPGSESPWDDPTPQPGPEPVTPAPSIPNPQIIPGVSLPTAEQARRYASIHGQALLNAPATLLGLPVDTATGAMNLGLRAASMVPGVPRAEIEGAVGGSQFNRQAVESLIEAGGGEVIPRSEMSFEERLGSTLTQLGAEQAAFGAGLATRIGGAASRSALPGVQAGRAGGEASAAGLVIDEMALPYVQSPFSQTLIDMGAIGGTALGIEATQGTGFEPYAALLGGLSGGALTSLGVRVPRGGLESALEALPDTAIVPSVNSEGVIPGLSYYTRADVNEAARRIQGMASSPEEAARRLGAALEGFYYREGMTPPSGGALTEDPGLLALEAGVRSTPEGERVLGARRVEIGRQIQQNLGETVLPQNLKEGIEPGTFVGARQFTDFLERQAQNMRGAAEAEFENAERHRDAAAEYLDAIVVGFRTLADDEAARSSADVQRVVVDEVLTPRLARRRELYDRARNSPEARQTQVDAAPVFQTIGNIEARAGRDLNRSDVPREIIEDIRINHEPGYSNNRTAAPMTYADMAGYDSRIRNARQEARERGAFGLAQQLDLLSNAIKTVERTTAANPNAPAGQLLREALAYEVGSFAPYFRQGSDKFTGSVTGSNVYQDYLANEYGMSTATGQRSGGERFFADYFMNASVPARQAALELRDIINLAPTPEAGIAAASEFLRASASRALRPDGSANSTALRTWVRSHGAMLQVFPDAARDIRILLGDVEAGEGAIRAARERVTLARRRANLTEQEIRQSSLSLVLGKSPVDAAGRILTGPDPLRATNDVLRRLRGEPEALRAFQDTVVNYIQNRVLRFADSAQDPNQAANNAQAFNRLFYTTDGALDRIFVGNENALRALENSRRVMNDLNRSRGFVPLGVPAGAQRPTVAQSALNSAELPVRMFYGHLRGGGVMRTLRIALSKIPGVDNEAAVNALMVQSLLNPEDLRILLTREGVNDRDINRVMTYARTVNAIGMGEQVRQELDDADNGNQ